MSGLIGNLFWIIVLFVIFLPLMQQKMMHGKRMAVIRVLERKRNSRVITLIHRQETMKLLGFPIMRYIDINDSEDILRAIRLTPDDMPIDMIIHTPGGLALSTEQIAMAMKRHDAKVTIFVPHYAMSGGTLLCLAAHEVFMDENAVLGPIDPQLGEYPAGSILRMIKEKDPKDIEDKTLILADVARMATGQMKAFAKKIMVPRIDPETAERIASTLVDGHWTHDYPITCEEASEMGLSVRVGLPEEIYELMDLFPQAMQRRPSVQYIPVPYKRSEEAKQR
jgi:ClpP class serine protease